MSQPPPWNGLYGRMPRARFEALYRPIKWAAHRREVRYAHAHETWMRVTDVLMEPVSDADVLVLPADCAPYRWRTLWRLTDPMPPDAKETQP